MHETWNVVIWHVNGGESIGYGTGLQDKELGMGKVNFCTLMQTGTRTTG